MSREDIGDYLGLTIETVSRGFAKLEANGLIAIARKSARRIVLLDHFALRRMAH